MISRGRYPLSGRWRLGPAALLLVLALGLAGVGAIAFHRWYGASHPGRPALGRPIAHSATPLPVDDGRRQPPPTNAGARASPTALGIARRTAFALWSFDWADPSNRVPASLRPWVTAGYWAELAASPGAPAGTAQLVGEHEVVRVISVTVTIADRSAAGVGVAVSAEVTVSSGGRRGVRGREDAEMWLARTSAGWRVASVDD